MRINQELQVWGLGEGGAAVMRRMTEAPRLKAYSRGAGNGLGKGRSSYSCGLTDGMVGWEIRGQGMESRWGWGGAAGQRLRIPVSR